MEQGAASSSEEEVPPSDFLLGNVDASGRVEADWLDEVRSQQSTGATPLVLWSLAQAHRCLCWQDMLTTVHALSGKRAGKRASAGQATIAADSATCGTGYAAERPLPCRAPLQHAPRTRQTMRMRTS